MDKIIFLDVDGVLQPTSNEDRFNHDLNNLRRQTAERLSDPRYENLNCNDIGAVIYDWNAQAVTNLKKLISETGAKIVVSSNWRGVGLERLCLLFRLHGLINIHIPDSVMEIEEYAFWGCNHLTDIAIPSGAKVKEKAFP